MICKEYQRKKDGKNTKLIEEKMRNQQEWCNRLAPNFDMMNVDVIVINIDDDNDIGINENNNNFVALKNIEIIRFVWSIPMDKERRSWYIFFDSPNYHIYIYIYIYLHFK